MFGSNGRERKDGCFVGYLSRDSERLWPPSNHVLLPVLDSIVYGIQAGDARPDDSGGLRRTDAGINTQNTFSIAIMEGDFKTDLVGRGGGLLLWLRAFDTDVSTLSEYESEDRKLLVADSNSHSIWVWNTTVMQAFDASIPRGLCDDHNEML